MKQTSGFYPRPKVDTAKVSAVGQAGGVLLTGTIRAAGLDAGFVGRAGPVAEAADGPRPGQGHPGSGVVAGPWW